jgi:small neutral amino acid transporter SnatA (MarC family)
VTILSAALLLFLILDPLGNIPVFLSLLKPLPPKRQRVVLVRELLIALAVRRGMGVMKFFRQHKLAIQRLGGLMLIGLGLLMVSGLWGEWTVQLQTWFQNEVKLPI